MNNFLIKYRCKDEKLHTIQLQIIRTGSKEHNIKLCTRARELGMQLKADGSGLFDAQLKSIKIESEEDIFRNLGLAYKSPEERN